MPWLGIKGEKEKIRGLRRIAERIGLEIKLYTEDEKVDIKITIPSRSEKIEKILKLPPHLIKTYNALRELKEGNLEEAQAIDISLITKRARAYESHNLRRLYEEGYITRRKEGRKAFYAISD